jgi:hypothetical protein
MARKDMVVVGASPGGVDALGRAAARHYFFKARVVLEHDRPIRAMALGREQLGSDDPALAPST